MDAAQVNGWLAVWGAVGPVLVGGASTWYNRRNQVQDRKAAQAEAAEQRAEDRRSKYDDAAIADLDRALVWRRNTLIEFLSASFDVLHKGEGAQEHDVRERHRERFAKAFTTLCVLDPAIRPEAANLWEACRQFSGAASVEEALAMAKSLADARAAFAAKANQLIHEQVNKNKVDTEAVRLGGAPAT